MIERIAAKDLELEQIEIKPKKKPWRDRHGELLVANELNIIRDHQFPPSDPRHRMAKTHRHITDKGQPGASGKHDPKSITTPDGTKYLLMNRDASVCELCEGGDMIPRYARFLDSDYKP